MPRSDRSLVFAAIFGLVAISFGAGATFVSAWSSQPAQYSERDKARIQTSYSNSVTALRASGNSADYAAYPEQDSGECYSAPNHDSADLCAQWRAAIAAEKAANAAWWAVTWTIIGTALSGLGLGALLFTLGQTERSLREAQKGNRIARKMAKRELRAYVAVKEHELEPKADATGKIVSYRFITRWFNSGATPARRSASQSNYFVTMGLADWPEITFDPVTSKTRSSIGAGQFIETSVTIDVGFLKSFPTGARLYVTSEIEYSDVFPGSPRRRSEVCSQLSFDGSIDGPETPNVRTVHAGPFNGLDKDCCCQPST